MTKGKSGFLTLRGGKFRGKKIPVPADGSVRPTTDRAREQAFALLDQHFRHADGRARWVGARVLDAFAGTGSLGLETLSRGASEVLLWDISVQQVSAINQTLKELGSSNAKATQQSALRAPTTHETMDLILLDPPYHKGLVDQSLSALLSGGWIGTDTLIYAECEAGCAAPATFTVLSERQSALSCLRLLKLVDQTAS